MSDEEKSTASELVPLTREEAIAAMKAGETLEDGIKPYNLAHYHWHDYRPWLDKDCFLSSDSYYDLCGDGTEIPEDQLPQLYRRVWKKKDQENGKNNA
jgi:hypothetical protein